MSSPAPALLARLREIVGAAQVLTAPEDTIPYGFDGTAALKGPVGVVVLPGSTQEVSAVVKLANEHGVTIVTRGSGTGLSGGHDGASHDAHLGDIGGVGGRGHQSANVLTRVGVDDDADGGHGRRSDARHHVADSLNDGLGIRDVVLLEGRAEGHR